MEGEPRESASEELRLLVPRSWKRQLERKARESAISVADLVRIFLRDALYGKRP